MCYKFGSDSYYYGEIAYLDSSDIVHPNSKDPKDNQEILQDPKTKVIKHGEGIYIYGQNASSRY